MDFAGIIGALSTSGAQWYKLVSSPSSVSVPAFSPPSTGAAQVSLAQQGITTGSNLLLIIVLAVAAVLIIRR